MSLALQPDDVDLDLLWQLFARFVASDTGARIGEHRIEPTDNRLATFAHDIAAPTLEELGAAVTIDDLNNVVGRFGPDRGTELLLVGYPALHHGNEMRDPLRPRRRTSDKRELWVGLGASQGKGGFAAACGAVQRLRDSGVDLAGRVILAVCSEGSSSHASAQGLFADFSRLPMGAILTIGTENRITLGNRGRVDVVVRIPGRATHSSSPESGLNPIPLVGAVLERLAELPLDETPHPQLGRRALVPYKLECGPVAPHTIPARCTLLLDRRILPGDDPDDAVAEIAHSLSDLGVSVAKGPVMLPALVCDADPLVTLLQSAAASILGRQLETFYPRYTFDAGFGCSVGVPTIMCGPSTSDLSGAGIFGEDAVDAEAVRQAAALYAAAIARNNLYE